MSFKLNSDQELELAKMTLKYIADITCDILDGIHPGVEKIKTVLFLIEEMIARKLFGDDGPPDFVRKTQQTLNELL